MGRALATKTMRQLLEHHPTVSAWFTTTQALFNAMALNLLRLANWLAQIPFATTRRQLNAPLLCAGPGHITVDHIAEPKLSILGCLQCSLWPVR
jgi:hypothetical protein